MHRVIIFLVTCTLFLAESFVLGADPTIKILGGEVLSEQDRQTLSAFVTDADGDPVTLSWKIISDPTGNAFLMNASGLRLIEVKSSTVRVGLAAGPNFPEPSFNGQQIVVRLEVSDGKAIVSSDWTLTVTGVNREPVLVFDKTGLGTFSAPKLTGEGLGIDGSKSYDPDGTAVKFLWQIQSTLGGRPCSASLVLFGKETATPGLPVPKVTSIPTQPMSITLSYTVEDGLNRIEGTVVGYMASPGGCNGNAPPVVGASASPSSAAFGEKVTLTGTASDPGDTLKYSWVQLGTTAGVALTTPKQKVSTFIAPQRADNLKFRFKATDSKGASAYKDVSVSIVPPPNKPPSARLSYEIEQQGESPAGSPPAVFSPSTIRLDASASSDEGPLAFSFALEKNLESGGAQLIPVTDSVQRLIIADGSAGAVTARVTVTDEQNLSDTAELTFLVEHYDAGPEAVVRYKTGAEDSFTLYEGQAIQIEAPNDVVIDASESGNDGPFLTSFLLQQDLLSGKAELVEDGEFSRRLEVEAGTEGTATVVVTVSNQAGQSDSKELVFGIEDGGFQPIAKVTVLEGDSQMEENSPVRQGMIVTLDATASQLANGDRPEGMTFTWTQISGDLVNLRLYENGRIARFRAPEIDGDLGLLEFSLVLENEGLQSEPAPVLVRVELPPVIYSQAAFGPFEDLVFRTVLVLINPSREELHYRVEFFDGQGQPLDIMESGEVWDAESFRSLSGGDARRLRFGGIDPERTEIGWARVTATKSIRGIVLYQLIDAETGELDSEVSLFASPTGRRLSSFFDSGYSLALALVNPGDVETRLLVQLIDPQLGPDLPVAAKPLELQPGEHFAGFLDESFFSGVPEEFQTGTLVIEAVSGEVSATILKTNRRGVAISSLPVVEEKVGLAPPDENN